MLIRNLDFECYQQATEEHRRYQQDWLRTGYAPRGYYLKDFCIFRKGKVFHLFHIAGTPDVSCCLPGNEIWFGHATTRDFREWESHNPCFYIDPHGWDNGHVFAPFVVEHDGAFWMFYTGVSIDNTQRIGLATSADLFEWRRATKEPIIRPEEYGWAFCPEKKGAACRDPHVIKIGNEFWMYYTAVTKQGRGCVARAVSTDLLNWQDCGPAYVAPTLAHCESSNVQELNGRYLLFFGGHYKHWNYVVSDDPAHWREQKMIPLRSGVTAMEVILRKTDLWLVGYFKHHRYRLFLGIVDWSQKRPRIVEISEEKALAEFIPAAKRK